MNICLMIVNMIQIINNVIKAISDCCCTTQRSIDSVNLNLTQMNSDNRLSICQQTNTFGLTIATDKTQIVDMVKQSYNDCKVKKESVLKYDEEMRRCEDILKLLNTTPDITTNVTKDFKELDELKAEVKELKQLLQNVTTVRPEVNEKVPQAEEKQIEI